MTKKDAEKIRELINDNMDFLEENLNERLEEILIDTRLNTQENLLIAREVFFEG